MKTVFEPFKLAGIINQTKIEQIRIIYEYKN